MRRTRQECARLFLALWLALMPGFAWAGSMTLMGVGKPAGGGGGGGGGMAFDAVSSNSVAGNAGTTLTWTHTPVGTPTAVAVTVMNYDGGAAISSVTYGGTSMGAAVASVTISSSSLKIYCLANPPSGAKSVVITLSATGGYTQAGAVTVTGSNTTTCNETATTNTGNGNTTSVSATSATGEIVVNIVGTYSSVSGTVGAGQTLRWGPLTVGGNIASTSSKPASAGTTSMSWTLGSVTDWGAAAMAFKN